MVGELDEAMHDGLGVDEGGEFFGWQTKKMVGFDEFEGLVHHGGGVDGDLGAHVPCGVVEGLLGCGVVGFFGVGITERATGCGEDDAADVGGVDARNNPAPGSFAAPRSLGRGTGEEALPEGGVFGVDGEELAAGAPGEGDDEVAGGDEGFFVGERDVVSAIDGGEGGGQACDADDGGDDEVGVGVLDELERGVGAVEAGDARGQVGAVAFAERGVGDVEASGLLGEEAGVSAGGEADDFEACGTGAVEVVDDFEGVDADGPGGAQDDHAAGAGVRWMGGWVGHTPASITELL